MPEHVASDPSFVRLLLRMEVSLNSQDSSGMTLLMKAATNCNADNDKRGCSPAFIAVANNKTFILQLFVENGAELTLKDCIGNGMLHHSALCGNIEVLNKLLDAGVPMDMKGAFYRTALYIAAQEGHNNVVAVLIAVVADNKKDNCQWTALQLAIREGHAAVILLDVGTAVDLVWTIGLP
ncbi:ankyrin repeat domain-containing protein 65-like [Halyomorpha halys]|uniref:ankyrin repeat domain-containing protein 65-like n=1 Tax=Halyomorpha halys TaxID=286706 RepID=UPI0006D4F3D3|nr:ankyrin repeat domain-containing protein 65-like [Halyomorpha halys]